MISKDTIGWLWAIASIALAFVELTAPGYYLIWIACAAALTSIVSFSVELSIMGQVVTFTIASIFACIAGHFAYRRWLLPSENDESNSRLNRLDADVIGAIGVASQDFQSGVGKVKLGDTYWLAESSENLQRDAPVIVKAVRGTALIVVRHK